MCSLIGTDAFQETFHPELPIGIGRTCARAVKLTDLGPKYLDGWVSSMHYRRKLDKVIHVLCNRVDTSCRWIDQRIWFIAYRPIFDGMIRSVRKSAYALIATGIIQEIYPSSCQGSPARYTGQFTEVAFDRA